MCMPLLPGEILCLGDGADLPHRGGRKPLPHAMRLADYTGATLECGACFSRACRRRACLPTTACGTNGVEFATSHATFCINSGDALLMREQIQELVKIKDLEESTLEKERLAAQEPKKCKRCKRRRS